MAKRYFEQYRCHKIQQLENEKTWSVLKGENVLEEGLGYEEAIQHINKITGSVKDTWDFGTPISES